MAMYTQSVHMTVGFAGRGAPLKLMQAETILREIMGIVHQPALLKLNLPAQVAPSVGQVVSASEDLEGPEAGHMVVAGDSSERNKPCNCKTLFIHNLSHVNKDE